jgi:Ricin-type beta-trefoil lectin domain-like/GDSL-like Lipase/Acylhydrolase family
MGFNMQKKQSKLAAAIFFLLGIIGLGVATVVSRPAGALEPVPQFSRVIALGDSYSAGVGARWQSYEYDSGIVNGRYVDSRQHCWLKNDVATGGQLAVRVAGGLQNFTNSACIGAEKPQLDQQIENLNLADGGGGTLIVMTAFGNDIRTTTGDAWPQAVSNCGDSRKARECSTDGSVAISDAEIQRLATNAADSYRKLLAKAPNATIRILGYPHLFEPFQYSSRIQENWYYQPTGTLTCFQGRRDLFRVFDTGGGTDFSGPEGAFFDRLVDGFNQTLSQAVAGVRGSADMKFVDVKEYFGDNSMCKTQTGRSQKIVYPVLVDGTLDQISSASLHPTTEGYKAYAQAVIDSLVTKPLDGKIVTVRSLCNRSSVLKSNSGGVYLEQTETYSYYDDFKPRERWLLRQVAPDTFTMQNQMDGRYIAIGDSVGAATTTPGAPTRLTLKKIRANVAQFSNPSNASLILNTTGDNVGTVAGGGAGCESQFELYILAEGPPVVVAANRFDGKLVTLRSQCGNGRDYPGVLDVYGNSKDGGAPIAMWGSYDGDNQRFRFKAVSDDTYEIRAASTGFALGADWNQGAPLQQRSGAWVQKWLVIDEGAYIQLRLADSPGLAVDLPGSRVDYGSGFQMYGANGTCAQKFEPIVIDESTPVPANVPLHNKVVTLRSTCSTAAAPSVVDVWGNSTADGAAVKVWTQNNAPNQQWRFTSVGADLYTVQSVSSGLYLAPSGAWIWAPIIQKRAAIAPRWQVIDNGSSIELRVANTPHMALDLYFSKLDNGNQLQTYTANGSCAQRFVATAV